METDTQMVNEANVYSHFCDGSEGVCAVIGIMSALSVIVVSFKKIQLKNFVFLDLKIYITKLSTHHFNVHNFICFLRCWESIKACDILDLKR